MTAAIFLRPAPAPASRRAYTLIEMLTIILMISTLIGLGSIALQRLIRAERAGRDALDEAATLARLADQFRRDAHAAVRVHAEPADADAPTVLAFESPAGGRTEYRVQDGVLIVSRLVPGDAADHEPDAQEETYRITRTGEPRLEVIAESSSQLAVLAIGSGPHATTREVRVEAVVGLDHRFRTGGGDR